MNQINQMIADAHAGDTVKPVGNFSIDALNDPVWLRKTEIKLDLSATELTVIPNSANDRVYFALGISGENDPIEVEVLLGNIKGDRIGHMGLAPPSGFGHGVAVDRGARVKFRGGMIADCMGDGICIFWGDAELDQVVCKRNRRQGVTFCSTQGAWIHSCDLSDNGGADPSAGVNFEPDPDNVYRPPGYIRNVLVEKTIFSRNYGAGVLIACPPERRSIINIMPSNTFVGRPIDGTDGIVPFYAKWLAQAGLGPAFNWYGYPREVHLL